MGVNFSEEILYGGVRKVGLEGTLDAPSAMSIEDDFKAVLIEQGGQVIVDLSGVDYMSSYGLRMLLVGAKTLHEVGGTLYLAAPNEHVAKVISVAGYDKMFPVYDSIDSALQDLGA